MRACQVGVFSVVLLAAFSSAGFAQGTIAPLPPTEKPLASDDQNTSQNIKVLDKTKVSRVPTKPPNFCLSDGDLRTVIVRTMIDEIREMADTCGKRYVTLSEFADNTLRDFDLKFAQDIDARDSATRNILRKSGLGELQQNEVWAAAQAEGQHVAARYSGQECKNLVLGIKVITDAGDFRLVEKSALLDWASRRAATPRCGDMDRSSSVAPPPLPTEKTHGLLDEQIKAHNAKVLEETKKRCLMPKSSLSFGSNRPPISNPLDAAIAEQEAKTEEKTFDLQCKALGILRE